MTTVIDMLSYGFIQRALVAGSLIAVLCAVLGMFLVLRRLSLIGDGLAHVTFGSVALALVAGLQGAAMLLVTLPVVLLSSLGVLRLSGKGKLGGDAAIGIVSSLGVATGVLAAGLGGGFNVDLFSVLFGSILAINSSEIMVAVALSLVVLTVLLVWYNDLVALTFSEELARVSGIRTRLLNGVLALLTALTVVLAMKLVGVLLISALLILPASTALQVARGFKAAVLLAVATALCAVIGGITVSFVYNLPTGATIIMLAFTLFGLAFLVRRIPRSSN